MTREARIVGKAKGMPKLEAWKEGGGRQESNEVSSPLQT